MGARRYHCPYCHTRFPHSREGRKRHHAGSHHRQQVRRYYRQFRSARERLADTKKTCGKFLSPQGCPFGSDCIYSHATSCEVEALRREVAIEEINSKYGPLPSQVLQEGFLNTSDVSQFLVNFRKEKVTKFLGLEKQTALPPNGPLPPSLQSYSLDLLLSVPLPEWG